MYSIEVEAREYQSLKQRILEEFSDVDEQTLEDTLEGATNLREVLTALIRSRETDLAMAEALRAMASRMSDRLARLSRRADHKKELVVKTMEQVELKRIEAPDFTLSLRSTAAPLVISDEANIPEGYWKPQAPKLDRQQLLKDLKAGQNVPGAVLGNGGLTLAVRTN